MIIPRFRLRGLKDGVISVREDREHQNWPSFYFLWSQRVQEFRTWWKTSVSWLLSGRTDELQRKRLLQYLQVYQTVSMARWLPGVVPIHEEHLKTLTGLTTLDLAKWEKSQDLKSSSTEFRKTKPLHRTAVPWHSHWRLLQERYTNPSRQVTGFR